MTSKDPFKILITGAGGMLGTDLVKALDPEFEVVGLDRKPAAHLPIPLEICDLTQPRKTQDCFVSHKPDLVIHAAALTDVDYCEDHQDEALANNVEATKNVVLAANEVAIPVIFFSTDYVFDGAKKAAYTEDDAPNPKSFYGKTKAMAEEFTLRNAKRALVFRISWLFGVYGRCFPKAILRQAAEVKKLTVVSDQEGHPTYTRDLAAGLATVMLKKRDWVTAPGTKIYHLTNSGAVSWADFARFILKESGMTDVKVTDIPSSKLQRPAERPLNSVLCLTKAKKELGLALRPWQEAVKDFLTEFREVKAAEEARLQARIVKEENEP